MIHIQKKKRNHSGSRSKSKKYRGNEYSVDVRVKNSGEGTKIKTQNSCSLNKSRPSRKNSSKQQKKHTKSNNKDSKDQASHSISADRRRSIIKLNHTQPNFESEQFEQMIDQVIMNLRRIPQSPLLNSNLFRQYFNNMQSYYNHLEGPFHRLCIELHYIYMNPIQKFLELLTPMEDAIRKKEQIANQIDKQIVQNQELYQKLEPIDIQIFKLKEKIEENRMVIEQKKQLKQLKLKEKETQSINLPSQQSNQAKAQPIGKGFKLDLNSIGQLGHMDYHEEFYSKIDQFSQSWRQLALKQKRY